MGAAFLLLLVAILAYLFFALFYLEINSIINLCCLQFYQLAPARLLIGDAGAVLLLNGAGWQKHLNTCSQQPKTKPAAKALQP